MATPPDWIATLVNSVISHIKSADLMPPVGCHYHYDSEAKLWEVTIFPSDTRIVGGQYDGASVGSPFFMDLKNVFDFMENVTAVSFQSTQLGDHDEIGTHVSIEGECEGNEVWLRILARAPRQFQAGREVSVYSNMVEDLW